MSWFGYIATPYETTSSDGYISTIFQIKGDSQEESKGSVVVMNGTLTDEWHWFQVLDEQESADWEVPYFPDYRPPLYDIVDEGYDLWVVSLRGSENNLGHTSLDWRDPNSGYYDFAME